MTEQYVLVPRSSLAPTSASSSLSTVAPTGLAHSADTFLALRPTPAMLSAVVAVPSSGAGRRGKKSQKFVGRAFNPEGPRPTPSLTTPMGTFRSTMESTGIGFTTSITVPTYLAQSIALSQFGAYTQYTSLFDEYQIERIECWCEPAVTMSSTVGSTMYSSVVDIDDDNTPAAFSDVADRQGAVISTTGAGHYHAWKPFVANALYSGAFTSFGSEPAPWCDCASPNIRHYGIKFATSGADGSAKSMNLTIRALINFRGAAI